MEPLYFSSTTFPIAKLTKVARQVDAISSEAVQDLGLTLTVSDRARTLPSDDALIERAHAWLISPQVSQEGSGVRLRIVAIVPGEMRCASVRSASMHKS